MEKQFDISAINGEIDINGFQAFCETVESGLNESEQRKVFDITDMDGSGSIGFTEFVELNHQTLKQGSTKAKRIAERFNNLTMEFHDLDEDGNGELNFREFFQFCAKAGLKLPGEQITTLFVALDTDHNGSINFYEFFSELIDPKVDLSDLLYRAKIGSEQVFEIGSEVELVYDLPMEDEKDYNGLSGTVIKKRKQDGYLWVDVELKENKKMGWWIKPENLKPKKSIKVFRAKRRLWTVKRALSNM